MLVKLAEVFIIFFPTVIGIFIGFLNISVMNKNYDIKEWFFLTVVLIIAGACMYAIL